MRYGTVPIAHKTGGLKDTVIDFDPWAKKGTGWTYTDCDKGVGTGGGLADGWAGLAGRWVPAERLADWGRVGKGCTRCMCVPF